MKKMVLAALLCAGVFSFPAWCGEWVDANLNQIELTPSSGGVGPEGIWFASPTPYAVSFTCTNNKFISIKDTKLADRTLSIALYAKATSAKVRVYVTGCDAQGYINATQSMLVTQ